MKKDRILSVLVVIAVIFMIICGCRLIWLILRKRLIFRYDRKIPDYFSVAGAP